MKQQKSIVVKFYLRAWSIKSFIYMKQPEARAGQRRSACLLEHSRSALAAASGSATLPQGYGQVIGYLTILSTEITARWRSLAGRESAKNGSPVWMGADLSHRES